MKEVDRTQCLAHADWILLVARFLSGSDTCLAEGATRSDLEHLLEACDVREPEPWLCLVDELSAVDSDVLQSESTRLFQGAVACPANETAYVRRDKGTVIADLCGFYRAFGFEPGSETGEKADHIAAELEFWAVLLVMAARASNDRDAEVTRLATASFLQDHLGEWYPQFCERLHATTSHEIFQGLANRLVDLWDTIAVRSGHRTCAELLQERDSVPVAEDGTPYECDMAMAESGGLDGCSGCGLGDAEGE